MLIVDFLPILIAILALMLRVSVVRSAALGLIGALLVAVLYRPGLETFPSIIRAAVGQSMILIASVMLVLVPGQMLNEVLSKSGRLEKITDLISSIAIPDSTKALIVVLGLAPAIESLTGFGVSLFVTVPILLHMLAKRQAVTLSLLSMNIMPWGTLALATIVAGQIAGQDPQVLGFRTAVFSIGIFPILGIASAYCLNPSQHATKQALSQGLMIGLLMGVNLILANAYLAVDIAGIVAGAVTSAVAYLIFGKNRRDKYLSFSSLVPYGVLLVLILAAKVVVGVWGTELEKLQLSSGSLNFAWYASPGLPLLGTIAVLLWLENKGLKGKGKEKQQDKSPLQLSARTIVAKVWQPIAGISCFILLSQIMRASGSIAALTQSVGDVSSELLIVLAPVLGVASGYLTGSNLGGNVLMMSIQQGIAGPSSIASWIPAVQNAASGHTLLASLPIIILVLSIADQQDAALERELVRYAFRLMLVILAWIIGVLGLIGFTL